MSSRERFFLILSFSLFQLLFAAGLAHAQANINESQESATLYVDVVNGNDNNPGTQSAPLQTIAYAASLAEINNRNGIGTLVLIQPGLYRENVDLLGFSNDTSLPETYQAVTPGTVTLTGSDPYTGWTAYPNNSSIYYTRWTNTFGLCPAEQGGAPPQPAVVLRREMVFINDTPLEQVLALTSMQQGTFFVDETNQRIYIWPADGVDPNSADVEVADRGPLFKITNKNAVVLRGLTFVHASTCVTDGAVDVNYGASLYNILIDSDDFYWNNALGLHLVNPTQNYTIENVIANHNGETGIDVYETKNGLWQNVTADYNNWRGAEGSFYTWGSAGIYAFAEHNGSYNNITVDYNETNAIHFDTNNENTIVNSLLARNNLGDGVFLEKNDGPMNLTSVTSCYNSTSAVKAPVNDNTSGGVSIRDSANVTLDNSVFYGNGITQYDFLGEAGGISIQDWETNLTFIVDTQDFSNYHNIINATDGTQLLLNDSYLNGADWTLLVSTLQSNRNTWWNPANADTPYTLPVPNPGTSADFDTWQADTGQDLNSQFAAPSGDPSTNCAVAPDGPDMWPLVNDSALTLNPAGSAVFTYTFQPIGGFSGDLNLTIDGVHEVSGLSATITPSTIPDGSGTATLQVNAQPNTPPGTYEVTVLANSGARTRASTVLVTVPMTSVRLSTVALDFGSVTHGQMSQPQNVSVTNTGTLPLVITSITIGSLSFTDTTNCGPLLGPGNSCTIAVTFAPRSKTSYSATLQIIDSDPTSPQSVALSGTGD